HEGRIVPVIAATIEIRTRIGNHELVDRSITGRISIWHSVGQQDNHLFSTTSSSASGSLGPKVVAGQCQSSFGCRRVTFIPHGLEGGAGFQRLAVIAG